jgi:hypothetical protein
MQRCSLLDEGEGDDVSSRPLLIEAAMSRLDVYVIPIRRLAGVFIPLVSGRERGEGEGVLPWKTPHD